jgi:GDPmannose 4,6-dehydratase
MFGSSSPRQNEKTPFRPRSPYGSAKLFAYWAGCNYRDAYGLHVVNGILFNHESPRRGETFVTRKITRAVARIHAGLDKDLWLGNIDAVRDWGYAPEYVEGMHRMMQADEAGDYVLATGVGKSVRDFLVLAFEEVGLDWEKYVRFDDGYKRPSEIDALIGDASLVESRFGWKARVLMPELVRIMVEADVRTVEDGVAKIDTPFAANLANNPDSVGRQPRAN